MCVEEEVEWEGKFWEFDQTGKGLEKYKRRGKFWEFFKFIKNWIVNKISKY